MARILGIHGIWNFGYYVRHGRSARAATDAISLAWQRALTRGLNAQADLRVCYYSHHLHRGTQQADGDPAMLEEGAQNILIDWADLLRDRRIRVQGPRTAQVRSAADWICDRFPGATRQAVLAFCRELHTYQASPRRRENVMDALRSAILQHEPDVLVAHSLGSVIAYETLWSEPSHRLGCLVTLGSPLGMTGVVFERLIPTPVGRHGCRPPAVRRWVNIADVGDIVAIPPGLSARFTGIEQDVQLSMGEWTFHAVKDYLSTQQVREQLRPYLRSRDPSAAAR